MSETNQRENERSRQDYPEGTRGVDSDPGFDRYIHLLERLYLQAVYSNVSGDVLYRYGQGILSVAGRDKSRFGVEEDAYLGFIDQNRSVDQIRRLANDQWKEYHREITQLIDRGHSPGDAVSRFMQNRSTQPNSAEDLEYMTMEVMGPHGTMPQWLYDLQKQREYVQRGMSVMTNTPAALVAMGQKIASDVLNHRPVLSHEEWEGPIASGEAVAPLADALTELSGVRRPRSRNRYSQPVRGIDRYSAPVHPETGLRSPAAERLTDGAQGTISRRGTETGSRRTSGDRGTERQQSESPAMGSSSGLDTAPSSAPPAPPTPQAPQPSTPTQPSRRPTTQRKRVRPRLPRGRTVARLTDSRFRVFPEPLRGDLATRQHQVLKNAASNPTKTGREYQQLIAEDLGAPDAQEAFPRTGRRPDIGTHHEVTIEGWKREFKSEKLDQLWVDLRDNGSILLTVPKLSGPANDQLRRLGAQAEVEFGMEVMIIVRETLP